MQQEELASLRPQAWDEEKKRLTEHFVDVSVDGEMQQEELASSRAEAIFDAVYRGSWRTSTRMSPRMGS